MLNAVIEILKENLAATKLFQQVNGLCIMINEPRTDNSQPKRYPAIYTGADNLKYITNYDFANGLTFFVNNSKTITELDSKRSDATFVNGRYTITLYAITKRGNIADILQAVEKALHVENDRETKVKTNVQSIICHAGDINTDTDTVLRDIFTNVPIKATHDLLFMRVNLTLELQYYINCLKEICC